jgi:hypothetical protein
VRLLAVGLLVMRLLLRAAAGHWCSCAARRRQPSPAPCVAAAAAAAAANTAAAAAAAAAAARPPQVYRPGSTSPAATLWEARQLFEGRSARADLLLREIRPQLGGAVRSCALAAGARGSRGGGRCAAAAAAAARCRRRWPSRQLPLIPALTPAPPAALELDVPRQRALLQAAVFGAAFCSDLPPRLLHDTAATLRVLNAVREAPVGLAPTWRQLELMGVPGLVARCARAGSGGSLLVCRRCRWRQSRPADCLPLLPQTCPKQPFLPSAPQAGRAAAAPAGVPHSAGGGRRPRVGAAGLGVRQDQRRRGGRRRRRAVWRAGGAAEGRARRALRAGGGARAGAARCGVVLLCCCCGGGAVLLWCCGAVMLRCCGAAVLWWCGGAVVLCAAVVRGLLRSWRLCSRPSPRCTSRHS